MTRYNKKVHCMKSVHVKCLFNYFKLCGVAPVDLNIHVINNSKVFSSTFASAFSGIAYNIFLISFIIAWCYFSFYESYFKPEVHFTFDRTVYIIVDVYSIVNTVCVILVFSFRQTETLVLFNKLNDIREAIRSDSYYSTYETKALFHKILTLLAINVPIWLVLIATIFMYNYERALMFSGLSFCIFVRNALTLQYCVGLKLIEHLLNVLNRNLSILSKYFSSPLEPRSIDGIDKNVSRLWEWYSLICKLTRDMSNFYSFPMLLSIQCEFLMTITVIYFIMKPFVFGMSSLPFIDYLNSLCFVLTHVCPIILLTTSVSRVINESQRTRKIINDYVKEPNTPNIKEKLLQFSIYLLHNNINFSIFDLFSLDGTLLVMIAGSVATYLVILLQFQPQSAT